MATSYPAEAIKEIDDNSYNEIWNRVVSRLRFQYGEAIYNSWLKPIKLEDIRDGEVSLSVPTRFIRDWILSNYADTIKTLCQEEDELINSIDVRITPISNPSKSTPSAVTTTTSHENKFSAAMESNFQNCIYNEGGAALDPRFTFENFVVGQTNALAHAAARSVAESEKVIAGSNPLFLYGGVGLGKTHLMHAIAWHIRNTTPKRTVIYLSAERFMYDFIRALRNKDIVTFKEYFRSVDVLMIDDIQFICGKNSTQEEFFHTFNALVDSNRQLILSGDRSPSDLDGMEERVRSRLGWGLVADINSTTYELRLGILQSKVENKKIEVSNEVLEFLASKISSNVRELEGALNRVIATAKILNVDITIDLVRESLRDLIRSNEKSITIEDIKQAVAEHCDIRIADMHSARRSRNVVRPRQIAMYLSKKLTPHSLPEIGDKFGGKDHTTVMHAVKRVEKLREDNKEISDDIAILTRILQN